MIQHNISLKPYNTFGFEVMASKYFVLEKEAQLVDLFRQAAQPFLVLGGGSNVCFTGDQGQLIIHNKIKGLTIIAENEQEVLVSIGAGENWHDVVLWCLDRDLAGIENLSLIPGSAGAAPIQNIGAYGVELKDVFHSLQAFDTLSGQTHQFTRETCAFGYRDSYFKNAGKGRYIITSVTLRLMRAPHKLNLEYGAIRGVLSQQGVQDPTIQDVSNAVIAIRQSKLPDPALIGNTGSFFKNPVIEESRFKSLLAKYPALPSYKQDDGMVKVPAGWLIEQAGWKGFREGHVGVHTEQALVLVHFGDGKGSEIQALAIKIREDILDRFGIELEMEVNII